MWISLLYLTELPILTEILEKRKDITQDTLHYLYRIASTPFDVNISHNSPEDIQSILRSYIDEPELHPQPIVYSPELYDYILNLQEETREMEKPRLPQLPQIPLMPRLPPL